MGCFLNKHFLMFLYCKYSTIVLYLHSNMQESSDRTYHIELSQVHNDEANILSKGNPLTSEFFINTSKSLFY